jgi:CCR4-NOT transcription complex subunit 1
MFLTGHSSSIPVLTRLWQVNSNLFIEGCLEMYKKDAMTISRILDIAQDLKVNVYIINIIFLIFFRLFDKRT